MRWTVQVVLVLLTCPVSCIADSATEEGRRGSTDTCPQDLPGRRAQHTSAPLSPGACLHQGLGAVDGGSCRLEAFMAWS